MSPGVLFYAHVSDQYAALHAKVINEPVRNANARMPMSSFASKMSLGYCCLESDLSQRVCSSRCGGAAICEG
jgi:hypothetical protein